MCVCVCVRVRVCVCAFVYSLHSHSAMMHCLQYKKNSPECTGIYMFSTNLCFTKLNMIAGAFVLLFCLLLLPSHHVKGGALSQERAKRQSNSDQQTVLSPTLTLVTNSPLNCSDGLTHPGVFVLVEYRLVDGQATGEWQLLDTVTTEPTGHRQPALIVYSYLQTPSPCGFVCKSGCIIICHYRKWLQ